MRLSDLAGGAKVSMYTSSGYIIHYHNIATLLQPCAECQSSSFTGWSLLAGSLSHSHSLTPPQR